MSIKNTSRRLYLV